MQLVLMGRTGSGKSKLARLVEAEMGIPLIASGDLARQMAKDSPHDELQLQAGFLAPESAMRSAVARAIEGALASKGSFILDGFPRSIAQYVFLMQNVHPHTPTFVLVEANTLRCIDRLIVRGRPDDNPDAIERKLRDYETNVVPLLDELADAGTLATINNDQTPEDAFNQLTAWLT